VAEQTENEPARDSLSPITPDLVRQVAEKVYALWLRDLKLLRERRGTRRR
jgi:hypothetical protein